jgi:hypothetical protein
MERGLHFFFLTLIPVFVWSSECAVTYELSPGRFGDTIQGYLHAKWISYLYKMPLLYKPFRDSEEFALHEFEMLWSEEAENSFDHVITYTIEENFMVSVHGSVLYIIPFFSELYDDRLYNPQWVYFPVDWNDEDFISLLRCSFSPRKEQPVIIPLKNIDDLTVALHVRRGGGFDHQDAYILFPLRFLPDSYYFEALRKLCALFPGRPIYAHLFTDDADPFKIVTKYQIELSDLPITFGCRKEGNRHDAHVLDDFFAMMQFDCLIRTKSNYSLIPAAIGRYLVVMTPEHYTFFVSHENNEHRLEKYIDKIDVKINSLVRQKH